MVAKLVESTATENILSFPELFHVMMAVDGSRAYLLGRGSWREDLLDAHGNQVDCLSSFDPGLALEVSRQAKSKGGKWDKPEEWNIWPAVHIGLLLPTLVNVLKRYGETDVKLTYQEAEIFFSSLPYLVNHAREYVEMAGRYHYQGQSGDDVKTAWTERLQGYFASMRLDTPWEEILAPLPEPLRDRVGIAMRHQENPNAENDSLIGRMVLAYLAGRGMAYETIGMDPRIQDYLRPLRTAPRTYTVKSLYERILDVHVDSLPRLIALVPILEYGRECPYVTMSDFSKIYRWYGTGKVVEMTKPNLVGAAQLGFSELSALFAHMASKGLDYHTSVPMPECVGLFKKSQSLQQVGRLSLIQDVIRNSYKDQQLGGEPLRQLAKRIWTDEERLAVWGSSAYYLPEDRNDKPFQQDVGNIVYCAGLLEVKRGDKQLGHDLKKLALEIKQASDAQAALRAVICTHQGLLCQLAQGWQERYPEHERTRIVHRLLATFCLSDG